MSHKCPGCGATFCRVVDHACGENGPWYRGWREQQLKADVRLSDPELLRASVGIIKRMAQTRVPAYELPADSFIENAVIDIINLARNST